MLNARVIKRKSSAKYTERIEVRYREQFAQAVLEYLNFSSVYADLAQRIARATAEHAAVVGSGRVGRTRSLSLEEKSSFGCSGIYPAQLHGLRRLIVHGGRGLAV